MQVRANGIVFHCRVEGPSGAPWVVLSNSLATDLSMWDPEAEALSRSYRVLRYDQRGHGRTEVPPGPYDFPLLMADALALMDALSIPRAHFCGLSMGGATGMGLAIHHPDRLDRLVVCDSPCFSPPGSAEQWAERCRIAQAEGMAGLVESTLARWYPPETLTDRPPQVAKVRDMILATPVDGFVGCAAALADHDFRTRAGDVRRPVLLLAGEKDGVIPAAMEAMGKDMPQARFVTLPGAGHISNLDRPDLFTQAVEDFLAA